MVSCGRRDRLAAPPATESRRFQPRLRGQQDPGDTAGDIGWWPRREEPGRAAGQAAGDPSNGSSSAFKTIVSPQRHLQGRPERGGLPGPHPRCPRSSLSQRLAGARRTDGTAQVHTPHPPRRKQLDAHTLVCPAEDRPSRQGSAGPGLDVQRGLLAREEPEHGGGHGLHMDLPTREGLRPPPPLPLPADLLPPPGLGLPLPRRLSRRDRWEGLAGPGASPPRRSWTEPARSSRGPWPPRSAR